MTYIMIKKNYIFLFSISADSIAPKFITFRCAILMILSRFLKNKKIFSSKYSYKIIVITNNAFLFSLNKRDYE